jgi:crossover junction endodeoxyribonuclease RuvC
MSSPIITVLGIDPGSTRAGYGLVSFDGNSFSFVDGGLVTVTSKDPHQRLVELYESFEALLSVHTPDVVGIEKLYFVKNIKTGIEVAQARGVLLMCLQKKGVPIYEFTPSEIKQGLTGYGKADKKAMEIMVKKMISIPEDTSFHDDTYDALGIAVVTTYANRNSENS